MQQIDIESGHGLNDYRIDPSLTSAIDDLEKLISLRIDVLRDKTIWVINSTAKGGGVAEMLPSQISILRSAGIKIEWLVMLANEPQFFVYTKQIHNAIHGTGKDEYFNGDNKKLYEQINKENALNALDYIKDGDVVIIHDPQPAAMGMLLKEKRDITLIWRCHIGLELRNKATDNAWEFLSNYLESYDHYVFSVAEYIPSQIDPDKTSIIPPAIDSRSYKNRMLPIQKTIGVLHQSGIVDHVEEMVYPFYPEMVKRVQPDGSIGLATEPNDLELLFRPVITQISRWDYLKGFVPLMGAFIKLKKKGLEMDPKSYMAKWIDKSRLIMAGPDLDAIQDDPEGMEVMNTIIKNYQETPDQFKEDIGILYLPMNSSKENALIVNALQRTSNLVVQNSIQEGFGLTATEAMWKSIPVVVSGATGLMQQVEDGVEGKVNPEAENEDMLMEVFLQIISDPDRREMMGRNGKNRVVKQFHVLRNLEKWIDVISKLV